MSAIERVINALPEPYRRKMATLALAGWKFGAADNYGGQWWQWWQAMAPNGQIHDHGDTLEELLDTLPHPVDDY